MAFYREIHKYKPQDTKSIKRWVFVLYDQLSWLNPLLTPSDSIATPGDSIVREEICLVFIETSAKPSKRSYHKQKLVMLLSSMRHFALEAAELGYSIIYHFDQVGYANGLNSIAKLYQISAFDCLEIQEYEVEDELKNLGSKLIYHSNNLYLSSKEDFYEVFPDSKEARKKYLQEKFYRYMRIKLNVLLDPNSPKTNPKPLGGKWNLDHENRSNWKKSESTPKPIPWIKPDSITDEVIQLVENKYADHFGNLKDFGWPVNRSDALIWLEHFVQHSLINFGKYEDAMDFEEEYLFHSMLSPLIHLGLLHPLEVVHRVIEEYNKNHSINDPIPLSSIEGFIRQIIGWREYMRHVYQENRETYQSTNYFNFTSNLPDLYWNPDLGMACFQSIISTVLNRGYSHHITRLMVLSNFANLLGVDPHRLNDWFWIAYVDAFEWVVTPNVVGMGTYADGGICSTKPYVASANYIKKMAPSYCKNCKYDATELLGDTACPFNALYWNFIGENEEFYSYSGRTDFALANWKTFTDEKKSQIRQQASAIRKKFLNQ
ncbi:cryptochrome/photolyase family protein [Leptospira sp. GIMC2001]|uniref:cryptochrome/photolyase family protein n=1 Tax=Leptospira sp. GIMC2001 TaxID=1513297 RepID=UPI00234C014B|nr:cryptochrome/photolyase family protein [Leptospira sp. GIMC2001]WCL49893.1 cryptochrome/photolyase family protein [Leptospira sp. GIMC2001]